MIKILIFYDDEKEKKEAEMLVHNIPVVSNNFIKKSMKNLAPIYLKKEGDNTSDFELLKFLMKTKSEQNR